MAVLNYSLAVSLSGGPKLNVTGGPTSVEAFDKIDMQLAPGGNPAVVNLAPGPVGQMRLLMVSCTPADEDVMFTINGHEITLEHPQTFFGSALSLFGADPNQITLTNETNGPAVVEILVVRDALAP